MPMPTTSASNSGGSRQPPWKLNPRSAGSSHDESSAPTATSPITEAVPNAATPDARRAAGVGKMNAPARPTPTHTANRGEFGAGMNNPRTLRNSAPPTEKLARGRRQNLQHGDIPEHDLQQLRRVADQLGHAAGEGRGERIGGEAHQRDGEPDGRLASTIASAARQQPCSASATSERVAVAVAGLPGTIRNGMSKPAGLARKRKSTSHVARGERQVAALCAAQARISTTMRAATACRRWRPSFAAPVEGGGDACRHCRADVPEASSSTVLAGGG